MNDIELRISILFKSINSHFERYKKPEPITEEKVLEDGKRVLTITIGGGETDKDERLEAINRINLIIHNLSNLKDNLKNYLKSNDMNENMVEEHINNSLQLRIIADLANQEKHGYPLQRTRRSELDPKIINIQNSLNLRMPVGNVAYNPMQGQVEITADIVDSNNNFLYSFNDLVEKSVRCWEDFILLYIPDIASEILEKRNTVELKKSKIEKIQHTINEANKVFENSAWFEISWELLVPGMIVRSSKDGQFEDGNRGYISDINLDGYSTPTALVYLESVYFESVFKSDEFRWQFIKAVNPNDLAVLTHYYFSCGKMTQELLELR